MTRLTLSVSLALLFVSSALAQSLRPHPYVELGASTNGGGYSPLSGTASTGINIDSRRFILESNATYDTAGKSDGNPKGHNIGFGSNVFYRTTQGWFFGGGMSWSKTITTNYTKEAGHPEVGGGKDFSRFRLQFMYLREENEITHYPDLVRFTPGPGQSSLSHTCHCGSGVNGITTSLWLPSPESNHHWFFHASIPVYWFHTTITDPYNLLMTKQQESHHDASGGLTYSLMYRF